MFKICDSPCKAWPHSFVLVNPLPRSYSGMCVIRDTNGSGSEEVWPSNRGKHSNQCLERPSDIQWKEACDY